MSRKYLLDCSANGAKWAEDVHQYLYYRWSNDFVVAGKKRLSGGTSRQANTEEVKNLRHAASGLDAQRLPASSVQQTHAPTV